MASSNDSESLVVEATIPREDEPPADGAAPATATADPDVAEREPPDSEPVGQEGGHDSGRLVREEDATVAAPSQTVADADDIQGDDRRASEESLAAMQQGLPVEADESGRGEDEVAPSHSVPQEADPVQALVESDDQDAVAAEQVAPSHSVPQEADPVQALVESDDQDAVAAEQVAPGQTTGAAAASSVPQEADPIQVLGEADGQDATAAEQVATPQASAAVSENRVDEETTHAQATTNREDDEVESLKPPLLTTEPKAQVPPEDLARALADQLRQAVQAALADFKAGLDSLPDSRLREAVSDWEVGLLRHMEELPSISQWCTPLPRHCDPKPEEDSTDVPGQPTDAATLQEPEGADLLQAEAPTASDWSDPAQADQEMEELRRVRRQIRSIFGGLMSSLLEPGSPQVDQTSGSRSRPPPSPSHSPRTAHSVPAPAQASPRRPLSRGTDLSASSSRPSQNEPRTRHRRHRSHHSRGPREEETQVQTAPQVPTIQAQPAAPGRPWSWAEEVVRASLDPQTQWDFSGRGGQFGTEGPGRPAGLPPPAREDLWERPRLPGGGGRRGREVVEKARDRAEEIQRLEKEQGRRVLGVPAA